MVDVTRLELVRRSYQDRRLTFTSYIQKLPLPCNLDETGIIVAPAFGLQIPKSSADGALGLNRTITALIAFALQANPEPYGSTNAKTYQTLLRALRVLPRHLVFRVHHSINPYRYSVKQKTHQTLRSDGQAEIMESPTYPYPFAIRSKHGLYCLTSIFINFDLHNIPQLGKKNKRKVKKSFTRCESTTSNSRS